jgi:hypothetical protein
LDNLRDAAAATLDVLQKVWQRLPAEEVARTPPAPRHRELLQFLEQRWPRRAGGDPPPYPRALSLGGVRGEADKLGPAREWVRLAENFVATQAVLYTSQFFVHLRNLLLSVTVGTLLLLLAATSYPFQPQSLLVVYLLLAVGVVTFGTVMVFVQINRDPFVSRLSNTTPERFTPDLAFLGSFATYVLPLLGVLAVQLSGSFRLWLEPIFRIAR